jgi:hypothetical protein
MAGAEQYQPQGPAQQPGFKGEIEAEKKQFEAEMQAEAGIKKKEAFEGKFKNIDELVDRINEASFKDLKQYELQEKYGKGPIAKIKAFLSGEYDFGIDEKDQIRRNGWNKAAEAGRKVLSTIFNRRVVAATAMAAALGVITGGVGAAAGGVVFGSIAGRGFAEAYAAIRGKENGAREGVLKAERARWGQLKEWAERVKNPDVDPQEKFDLMHRITDLYYKQGESYTLRNLQSAEEKFVNEKKYWDKLRGRAQTIGEFLGLGAGVAHGFLTGRFASIDIDLWNKIKGQSIMHEVVRTDGVWRFAYTASERAAGMGGGALTHVLGEPAWKIAAATIAERGLPVLIASWLASIRGKKRPEEAGTGATEAERIKGTAEKYRPPQPPTPEEIEQTNKEKAQVYIDKLGAGKLPEAGQIWRMKQTNAAGEVFLLGTATVERVDWQKNIVYYTTPKKYADGRSFKVSENRPMQNFLDDFRFAEAPRPSRAKAVKPKETPEEPKSEKPAPVEKEKEPDINQLKDRIETIKGHQAFAGLDQQTKAQIGDYEKLIRMYERKEGNIADKNVLEALEVVKTRVKEIEEELEINRPSE